MNELHWIQFKEPVLGSCKIMFKRGDKTGVKVWYQGSPVLLIIPTKHLKVYETIEIDMKGIPVGKLHKVERLPDSFKRSHKTLFYE